MCANRQYAANIPQQLCFESQTASWTDRRPLRPAAGIHGRGKPFLNHPEIYQYTRANRVLPRPSAGSTARVSGWTSLHSHFGPERLCMRGFRPLPPRSSPGRLDGHARPYVRRRLEPLGARGVVESAGCGASADWLAVDLAFAAAIPPTLRARNAIKYRRPHDTVMLRLPITRHRQQLHSTCIRDLDPHTIFTAAAVSGISLSVGKPKASLSLLLLCTPAVFSLFT